MDTVGRNDDLASRLPGFHNLPSESLSFYEVLGVAPTAPIEEILETAQALALSPDNDPGQRVLAAMAWEALGDDEWRPNYDRAREKAARRREAVLSDAPRLSAPIVSPARLMQAPESALPSQALPPSATPEAALWANPLTRVMGRGRRALLMAFLAGAAVFGWALALSSVRTALELAVMTALGLGWASAALARPVPTEAPTAFPETSVARLAPVVSPLDDSEPASDRRAAPAWILDLPERRNLVDTAFGSPFTFPSRAAEPLHDASIRYGLTPLHPDIIDVVDVAAAVIAADLWAMLYQVPFLASATLGMAPTRALASIYARAAGTPSTSMVLPLDEPTADPQLAVLIQFYRTWATTHLGDDASEALARAAHDLGTGAEFGTRLSIAASTLAAAACR